jgi:mono/diheme cytochrome c family protein
MKTMQKLVNSLFRVTALLCVGAHADAQGLPEGDGLKVLAVSCTQCHGLDRLTKLELTGAEWENALYDMMARGAVVEQRDLAVLRRYLVDNFAVDKE